jgi:hypothetical protein
VVPFHVARFSKMGTATGAQRAPPVPSNDDPMGSSALAVLRAKAQVRYSGGSYLL